MDWLNDPRVEALGAPQRPPRRRRFPTLLIVSSGTLIAIMAVSWLLIRKNEPTPVSATASPQVSSTPQDVSTSTEPAATQTAAVPTVAAAQTLVGNELAQTWLRAYLNRSPAESTTWVTAIEAFSSQGLQDRLRTEDPKLLGISLTHWKVTAFKEIKFPDQGVNTSSRHISSWVVTITDGKTNSDKPFTVAAYLGPRGWEVSDLIRRPSSRG